MINKNKFGKVNLKILIILIIVTAAIVISLFTARQVRRSFLLKMDLEAGQAAFEKQDWPTASKKLRAYLSRNPDDVEILKKYAKAALYIRPLSIDAISGAIGAYRRVVQLAPLDEVAYEKLAMLYEGVGNFEELAYIARTRITNVPDDRKAPLWLTEALFRLHKTNEAKQVLSDLMEKLEKLDDKCQEYVQACVLMSAIILSENPVNAKAKALEMLNKAVNYNPQSAEALVNRARFYREMPEISNNSKQLARVDLEAADALSTEDPKTQLSLGVEWMAHGELILAAAKLKLIESIPQEKLEEYFFDMDDWTVKKFLFASQLAGQNMDTTEGVSLSDEILTELKEKGHRVQVLPAAIRFYIAAGKVQEARHCLDEYIEIISSRETPAESKLELAYLQSLVAKAEGRLRAVIDTLQPIVVSNPDQPIFWRLLAEAYSQTNQSRRAINALKQFLRFYPQDPEMTMQLASEYLKLRDWNKAFETAQMAESLDPTVLMTRLLRIEASINLAAEQTPTADSKRLTALSVELAELQKQNPDRVNIRMLQAMIDEHLQKPDQAEVKLKLAIEECKEPLQAEMQLVRHYSGIKRMDEAIKVCQAACERHSDASETWLSLSNLHVADKDYNAAISSIRRGLQSLTSRQDKKSLSIRLAVLEILYADRTAGINLLKQVASQDEGEIQARLLLLDMREIREDPATAQKLITELRKAEGESGLYWRFHQASLWLSSEDWRSKQPDITNALQFCIDSDPQWSLPVLLLVRMYERLEDFTRLEDTCRQALIRNPSSTIVANTLISHLERQGRFSEVNQVLQQINANPRAESAWSVRTALREGDLSRAIDELKIMVSNDDRDINSRIQLAMFVYQQTRDAGQAFQYLKEAEAIMPDFMPLIAAKVSILNSEDRKEEARQILDDYVTDSNSFNAYSMRAAYLAGVNEPEHAEADYRKLTTFPGQQAAGYELLSNFYARNQEPDKAIATLEEGLNTYPEDLRLKRSLMKALLLKGQAESRQKAFEILATLEQQLPQDPELMKLRAMQLLEEPTPQSLKTARQKLEHATRLEPTAVDAHLALIDIAMKLRVIMRFELLVPILITQN
jgi:tetratricopeptide (TPR) repeat protein